MKGIVLVLLLTLALALAGCSGESARELFETAQLEERQNALDHAMKLYRELVEKHPESEYAPKAKERLSALQEKK